MNGFYFYSIDPQTGIIRVANLLISVDKDPLLDQMLARFLTSLIHLDLPGFEPTQVAEMAQWVGCTDMTT